MRHGLLILLCLLAVTWFEYQVYPGHTYLQGETLLLVPMLERLDTPGFLSRDLVASNPTLTATIYDEITGVLHNYAQLAFKQALQDQQISFRFAALFGIFLLARSLGVPRYPAIVLSAIINAVTRLTAPNAYLTNPEPTPTAFAVPLVLLGCGMLAHRRTLLACLFGGLALLYDPMTSAVFWFVVIFNWIADRSMRKLLSPAWVVLLIFALILGNLVQLQSGIGDSSDLLSTLRPSVVHIIQFASPWIWVSTWIQPVIWNYIFVGTAAVCAFFLIRARIPRLAATTILALACSGFLSTALALALLWRRLGLAAAMPPAKNLAFTMAASLVLCGAASFEAAAKRNWRQCIPFAVLLIAALLNPQVLDLLKLKLDGISHPRQAEPDTVALAAWARDTWGSSLFQFPDADKAKDPGVFRALSRRALWADWPSGVIATTSETAGREWWSRWQANMQNGFSTNQLTAMLPLPIDYYVLRKRHELEGVKPVYANSSYVVYDAQDLRDAQILRLKRSD